MRKTTNMICLYIDTVGAITALGHSARRTVATLRTGVDGFEVLPFQGESQLDLQAAPITGYAEGMLGIPRYQALAEKALAPCVKDLSPAQLINTAIFIGLPRPERPVVPANLAPELTRYLKSKFSLPEKMFLQTVPLGRTAVFWALHEAMRRGIENVIVGGVDTLVNPDSLTALSEQGLLKEEWDGFIPGEAAAFVRLSTARPRTGCWGGQPVAVRGVGVADEPADGTAEHPIIGVGLKNAYQSAMENAGAKEEEITLCINDIAGARVSFEDEGYAWTRYFRVYREHLEVWHTGSYLGETGAAVGALELIWGSAALELGFAPGRGILASASEAKLRTAAFLDIAAPYPPIVKNDFLQIGMQVPVVHYSQEVEREAQEDEEDTVNDPGLRINGVDKFLDDQLWMHFNELDWLIELRETHHTESEDPWADIEEFELRLLEHLDAIAWGGSIATKIALDFIESDEPYTAAAGMFALLSWPADDAGKTAIFNAITESNVSEILIDLIPLLPKLTAAPILQTLMNSDSTSIRNAALHALINSDWLTEAQVGALIPSASSETIPLLIEAIGAKNYSALWPQISAAFRAGKVDSALLTTECYFSMMGIGSKQLSEKRELAPLMKNTPPVPNAIYCLRHNQAYSPPAADITTTTPEMIEAIGWGGNTTSQGILLNLLDQGSDEQKEASANALYRIFGCPLFEDVEVPVPQPADEPEEVVEEEEEDDFEEDEEEDDDEEVANPADESEEEKIAPIVFDEDSDEPSNDTIEVKKLSQDRAKWEEALSTRNGPPGGILRHGEKWTKGSALRHLARQELTYNERVIAAWEHAIVNSAPLPLNPWHFVALQKKKLQNLNS
ncbi:MAG: hypothetical protein JXX14_13780 [Deltaproteobacteria bacterium]|nr:hypothetical protein [Deltaproteobacteria bacterium]